MIVLCSLPIYLLSLLCLPLSLLDTEASHPAVHTSSPISLISPTLNTTLVATATLDGTIHVWQTRHALFLQVMIIIIMIA